LNNEILFYKSLINSFYVYTFSLLFSTNKLLKIILLLETEQIDTDVSWENCQAAPDK